VRDPSKLPSSPPSVPRLVCSARRVGEKPKDVALASQPEERRWRVAKLAPSPPLPPSSPPPPSSLDLVSLAPVHHAFFPMWLIHTRMLNVRDATNRFAWCKLAYM
jgi:hypothetical protein